MNERERLLLYEMLRMARGKLIQLANVNLTDKSVCLMDFVGESSRILGALEEIYFTPIKDHKVKK
jgi:hypothetical protein